MCPWRTCNRKTNIKKNMINDMSSCQLPSSSIDQSETTNIKRSPLSAFRRSRINLSAKGRYESLISVPKSTAIWASWSSPEEEKEDKLKEKTPLMISAICKNHQGGIIKKPGGDNKTITSEAKPEGWQRTCQNTTVHVRAGGQEEKKRHHRPRSNGNKWHVIPTK